MRLSNEYISVFNNAITKFLPTNAKAELRLFGSRINDNLKGGDIDLLLVTDTAETANFWQHFFNDRRTKNRFISC